MISCYHQSQPTERQILFETCQARVHPDEEANGEIIEPTVAVTPGHAAGPQPSTSTAASTPKSPEELRPYPKTDPRNEKTRRGKARKSTILSDTPERERAALAAEGKKKKKLN